MGKDREEAPPQGQTVTITLELLNQLIESRTKETVAAIMGGKTVDEKMVELMDQQRGKNRPLAPEETIACRSPITGSTMTVRVVKSKSYPDGRVVEMSDYVRPEGWDRHKEDGGLYDGLREGMVVDGRTPHQQLNKAQHKYLFWLYSSFWQKDWNLLSGKPASFLAQWRLADKAAE